MRNQGGSIKKLQNGKYLWTGYIIDENGKKHRPNRTFNTKAEADAFKKSFLLAVQDSEELLRNRYTGLTVEAYYKIWKEKHWPKTDKEVKQGKYTFATVTKWEPIFEKYIIPTVGYCKIDNIKFKKYESLLNDTKIVDKTVGNINSAFISMLDMAFSVEQILSVETISKYTIELKNIRKRLNKPEGHSKDDKTVNLLSQRHYKLILDYMKDHNLFYANLIEFCRETGIRISECALLEDDIEIVTEPFSATHFKYGVARINKTLVRVKLDKPNSKGNKTEIRVVNYTKSESSNRSVPLNNYAIECIERQKELKNKLGINSSYLFTTSKGNLIDQRNVLRSLHDVIRILNKNGNNIPKVGLHSLRKLFGNDNLKHNGIEMETVSKAMGHASLQTTSKYYISYDEDDALKLAKKLNNVDTRIRDSKLDRMKELFVQGQTMETMMDSGVELNHEIAHNYSMILCEFMELCDEFGIEYKKICKGKATFCYELYDVIKYLFDKYYMKG